MKIGIFGKFLHQMLRAWSRLFRPQMIWEDESIKHGSDVPLVFAVNHKHLFDGPFIIARLDRFRAYALVARDQFKKQPVGFLMSRCRTIPVSRAEADAEWFKTAQTVFKQGGHIIVFPEGGISRTGKMKPFKPGAVLLATMSGAKIVPCANIGQYKLLRRHRLVIGTPIDVTCPENERPAVFAREQSAVIQAEVQKLLDRYTQVEK